MVVDWNQVSGYFYSLNEEIPYYAIGRASIVFCIGTLLFISWKGLKTGIRLSSVLFLLEYIFLILCSTVFFRTTREIRKFDFHPFWSYKAIGEGRTELLPENIMNVLAFVPIGLLFGIAFKHMAWWKVALIGCCISVSIEGLQFWLMKGFSELDDVMHNTMGCILGYLVFLFVAKHGKRGIELEEVHN